MHKLPAPNNERVGASREWDVSKADQQPKSDEVEENERSDEGPTEVGVKRLRKCFSSPCRRRRGANTWWKIQHKITNKITAISSPPITFCATSHTRESVFTSLTIRAMYTKVRDQTASCLHPTAVLRRLFAGHPRPGPICRS